MHRMSRRKFLKTTAVATAAAGCIGATGLQLRAGPLGLPIGCQTWPVRQMIAKDFPGTLKQLSTAGFQTIELCSQLVTRTVVLPASQNTPATNSRKS